MYVAELRKKDVTDVFTIQIPTNDDCTETVKVDISIPEECAEWSEVWGVVEFYGEVWVFSACPYLDEADKEWLSSGECIHILTVDADFPDWTQTREQIR